MCNIKRYKSTKSLNFIEVSFSIRQFPMNLHPEQSTKHEQYG